MPPDPVPASRSAPCGSPGRRLWPVGLFCSPWPEQALRANIHCQISLALNRIYTEWYPSKGYSFNITNSTSYDQYYVHGRTVFNVMVRLTDDIFNTYFRKTGTVNPYYAEYCDGKSVTCPGLKQWGTVTLANQGRSALSILKYYFGSNIEIIRTNNIQSIPQSYPGSPLRQGSTGAAVFTLQRQLNRITKDYPFLGLLTVDGIFGRKITETVKEISPLYHLSTHYDVGGTLTIPSYDESTQKITMAYATEFTALTSTSGKFTSISLGGFLAGALTKISMALINNSKFDIVSYVIRKMAEAVSEWLENELINGTDGKIEGVSKVTAAVTPASATAIPPDDLRDLQDSIPDKLQPRCIGVMSRATRTAIRKLKDGEGNYLLNKDATAKWGYSLFGHDVYVSQSMPDMAAGKRAVLYLDPTGLAVKVAENPSVQVLREKFADEHAVGVICWMEVDSKVENKQKIAVLDMKAAVTPGG